MGTQEAHPLERFLIYSSLLSKLSKGTSSLWETEVEGNYEKSKRKTIRETITGGQEGKQCWRAVHTLSMYMRRWSSPRYWKMNL